MALSVLLAVNIQSSAQSPQSGTLTGTVADPSGAALPGATICIRNPVSQYERTTTTDGMGRFQFGNVPWNAYHMSVSARGFGPTVQDVEVRSGVPTSVPIILTVAGTAETVTVKAEDLVENDSTMHTDVDRQMFSKIALESESSSVSSLLTLAAPGVAADSNGLFHGMGDHGENSFSVDGQPITDQQSKVFSNQIPASSIESMQVIDGAPPAEYGDKTSLVIQVTTRSGQGMTKPTGSIYASYGAFGAASGGFDLGYGGQNWGNFITADGLQTGRFLDPPEFRVFHAKGNEENVFDRVDYQPNQANSFHLNLNYTRSWFQTPDTWDNLNVGVTSPVNPGDLVGPTDQRSKIGTFNIAPSYTRVISQTAVFTLGAYLRKDVYRYYPSGNPFADRGPLQGETIAQVRSLANAGLHADLSHMEGIHNFKAGFVYAQTFLRESDFLGIVDPAMNVPGSSSFIPALYPYDLTRGGSLYDFRGRTDVKEIALFLEDRITTGHWLFNVGIRGDLYNGLSTARQAEPRVGASYSIKQTNTVLRASYARIMETPFNENLVLSSRGCLDAVVNPLLGCQAGNSGALAPGFRNEFHAGLQQAFGKYAVVSGEYIWKYTHNGFDFSVLGNTPITFPIEWHNSKIPGLVLRADVPTVHNFSAFVTMSSVASASSRHKWAELGRPWENPVIPSKSIMARDSTRRLISSISYRAATAPGTA